MLCDLDPKVKKGQKMHFSVNGISPQPLDIATSKFFLQVHTSHDIDGTGQHPT